MRHVTGAFLALQFAALALAFGMGGDAKAPLLLLSLFFAGASVGSVGYSSIDGGEVNR